MSTDSRTPQPRIETLRSAVFWHFGLLLAARLLLSLRPVMFLEEIHSYISLTHFKFTEGVWGSELVRTKPRPSLLHPGPLASYATVFGVMFSYLLILFILEVRPSSPSVREPRSGPFLPALFGETRPKRRSTKIFVININIPLISVSIFLRCSSISIATVSHSTFSPLLLVSLAHPSRPS